MTRVVLVLCVSSLVIPGAIAQRSLDIAGDEWRTYSGTFASQRFSPLTDIATGNVAGEFLFARQYAKQTWAEGIDPRGRPVVFPGMEPSEKGTLVYPSLQGATNWASPSFSPRTGLMYVAVREMGSIYFKSDVEYRPGTYYTGGSEKRLDDESWGSIRALHVDTGAAVWDFKLPTPPWGGVLSTAGGLVFAGSNEGNVFALDARTGDPLWQFQAGGPMRSNPMSFSVEGRQHVAVAAGRAYVVFALPHP